MKKTMNETRNTCLYPQFAVSDKNCNNYCPDFVETPYWIVRNNVIYDPYLWYGRYWIRPAPYYYYN